MWFAVSSIYAMSAVCPFCGQAGCAVGSGSVGLVGGFFALCTLNWKNFIKKIGDMWKRQQKLVPHISNWMQKISRKQ
jgi:hypothetical protein